MTKLLQLNNKLKDVLDEKGYTWLQQSRQQLAQLEGDLETAANKVVFFTATAKRKLGLSLLSGTISSGFAQDANGQCDKVYLDHWSVADAARVLFLADVISSGLFSADHLFQICYRYSDGGERASLLKGLALMKLTSKSSDFIIDVARTNSLELFSALVYKNPWPVVNLPVPAVNQLVLKSLFMGVSIFNVEGLRAIRNAELGRMAADYAQERLDAGREIPESIWLAVDASKLSEQGLFAWEAALKSATGQDKSQLAFLGCQWQSEIPARLQGAVDSLRVG